jgi:hypothetical protein
MRVRENFCMHGPLFRYVEVPWMAEEANRATTVGTGGE